jgi:chemotaxis protein methyltransferase WspC
MIFNEIESFLEHHIGLSINAMGTRFIRKHVQRRMEICGLSTPEQYLTHLRIDKSECNALVEAVVIPESWFFRLHKSFLYLARHVREKGLSTGFEKGLRVLSLPCSTGEEPYSIAITLLEAGLPAQTFHVDALDISHKALKKAQEGIYGNEAFREKAMQSLRERYFDATEHGFAVPSHIKSHIRFCRHNLFDPQWPMDENCYQIIFCRNLMIYLTPDSQAKAINTLHHMLTPDGILFTGHAERSIFKKNGFEFINEPGIFACRKTHRPIVKEKPYPTVYRHKIILRGIATCRKTDREPPVKQTHKIKPAADAYKTLVRLADQGSFLEAQRHGETFLEHNPAHVHAHFLMGVVCQALGDESEAEKYFNKALYLEPHHEETLTYLILMAEKRNDTRKACVLRQRMQRIKT